MTMNHMLLGVLWVVFCCLHSFLAREDVKQKVFKTAPPLARYYRLIYTVFAFATMTAIITFQYYLPSPDLFPRKEWIKITGYGVSAGGLILMAVCIRKYFVGLSGIKSIVIEKPPSTLIVTGVHRYVRHPLYLGTFIFLWGLFLLIPTISMLISNLIITGYTILAIPWEEKKLVAEFGEGYRRYQSLVHPLLPRLKSYRESAECPPSETGISSI